MIAFPLKEKQAQKVLENKHNLPYRIKTASVSKLFPKKQSSQNKKIATK